MLRILAATVLATIFAHGASAGEMPKFEVGQKWSIKDSPIEGVIGRIDSFPGGKTAISVSVFNVPCPPDAGCTAITMGHTPFDSTALAKSVDKLIGEHEATAPQFEAGYANWQQAKGGIFHYSREPASADHVADNSARKSKVTAVRDCNSDARGSAFAKKPAKRAGARSRKAGEARGRPNVPKMFGSRSR